MDLKDKIISTYKRKVIAHPEGAVVHMGDCGIYNSFLGVCTCGLHHWLWMAGSEVIKELYPNLVEEESKEGFIEYLLQEFEIDNLYVKDNGEFVKVEKPKLVSEEEFNNIFNKLKENNNDDD